METQQVHCEWNYGIYLLPRHGCGLFKVVVVPAPSIIECTTWFCAGVDAGAYASKKARSVGATFPTLWEGAGAAGAWNEEPCLLNYKRKGQRTKTENSCELGEKKIFQCALMIFKGTFFSSIVCLLCICWHSKEGFNFCSLSKLWQPWLVSFTQAL